MVVWLNRASFLVNAYARSALLLPCFKLRLSLVLFGDNLVGIEVHAGVALSYIVEFVLAWEGCIAEQVVYYALLFLLSHVSGKLLIEFIFTFLSLLWSHRLQFTCYTSGHTQLSQDLLICLALANALINYPVE